MTWVRRRLTRECHTQPDKMEKKKKKSTGVAIWTLFLVLVWLFRLFVRWPFVCMLVGVCKRM